MGIEVVPANQASCEDLTTVFGGRGAAAECQCQRYRLARGEAFRKFPVEERSWRLRVSPAEWWALEEGVS